MIPKRQTIRADRKRHARPGEEIQHYCGMRTKGCFLIGLARCVSVEPISMTIDLKRPLIYVAKRLVTASRIESFARADGFQDWPDMFRFWCEEHPDIVRFLGVLIKWEPIKEHQP